MANAPAEVAPPTPTSRLPRGLSAFRHRNYRLFFTGQFISVTGTWMQSVAQSWLVLSLTNSPLQFSLVSVLQYAPVLFLAVLAGVVADRFPKRSIIVVTQTCAMLIATTMSLLVATGAVRLWHVYVLAFLLGIVSSFDMPTRQAFVVEMVGREDMSNAIAFNSSLYNAARIIGPAIAGIVMAATSPAWVFGIDAASYLAVIASLLMMTLPPTIATVSGTGIQRMREGFAFIRQTPIIMMTMILIGFVAIFGLNYAVWLPLLAKNEFGVGAGGFGILMSALGVGSLIGALMLAFSGRGARPRLVLLTMAVLGATQVALAICARLSAGITVAYAILPVMGFVMSVTTASANTAVQLSCPMQMRGRVMSVYMALLAGVGPIGALLVGVIAERFGTPASVIVCGSVTALAACGVAYAYRAWRADAPAVRLAATALQDLPALAVQSGSRD